MENSTSREPWLKHGEEKREAVQRLFSEIAPSYDRVNGWMSLNLHSRWRQIAVSVLGLREGDAVLDICCGTGDFLSPLRKAVGTTGHVFGADFCLPMLQIASEKSPNPLAVADACALPYQASQFEAVTVGWGLRNVPDIDLAISEATRVLKPGGRFLSLDMARPEVPLFGAIAERMFHVIVPLMGKIVGHPEPYAYLPKSTERFDSRATLAARFEKAGLRNIRSRNLFFGNIFMIWGEK